MNEVDTGSPLAGVAVKGSVGLDEVGHIRDVNTYVICAILIQFHGQGVIKIFGSGGVNSENPICTKIFPIVKLPLWDSATKLVNI